jgi:hypothetical protein
MKNVEAATEDRLRVPRSHPDRTGIYERPRGIIKMFLAREVTGLKAAEVWPLTLAINAGIFTAPARPLCQAGLTRLQSVPRDLHLQRREFDSDVYLFYLTKFISSNGQP